MGMGIATKLVEATLKEAQRRGFTRAEAEAAVKNTASVKLAVRCGFKIEGKRKNGLLLDDGKYADTYLFGKILR
jgi:RimJ/RimL family protein N-acetyltransferase